jgi:hypothetical protein
VLSLLYAEPVRSAMYSTGGAVLMLRWVPVYWMVQLGFTIGVHLIWDDAAGEADRWQAAEVAAAASFVGVTAIMMGRWLHLPGETIYRGFLGFYGLVFPAYVWLAVLPGEGLRGPTRRTRIVLAIAIGIALPMFYMAFIERRLVWGVPGVFVVLLSRALVVDARKGARQEPEVEAGIQQNSPPTS